ncbi:MAG TPA: alpha/beta fold hydrolase [Candidatus Angelobacter sp.]|nr:alpha/beta fold hydrolase [Candidatus Angelobacter sp.]
MSYLLFTVIAGIAVTEGSIRLVHRPLAHRPEAAAYVREHYQVELQEVSIPAADAAVLKGWYVHPHEFNGSTVLLSHGITDNREGVASYGRLFLDHGYAVLLPDTRNHGESGGEFALYGLKEADDIHQWVNWLYEHDPPRCVYGFGESLGAALVLQSLAKEPRFCAVAVEDAFSTARAMSYERISGFVHLGDWFGRSMGRPIIASAVVYARLRYDIDLLKPSPLDAVRHSSVPVLLVHGTDDRSISPWHSLILAQAAPDHVQLWLVPAAGHTMAWTVAPKEFEARVVGWFESHQKSGAFLNAYILNLSSTTSTIFL